MAKKIKKLAAITLILFCIISLFIALMAIWDIINNELAKEAIIKTSYTLGAIFIVSLVILLVAKTTEEK